MRLTARRRPRISNLFFFAFAKTSKLAFGSCAVFGVGYTVQDLTLDLYQIRGKPPVILKPKSRKGCVCSAIVSTLEVCTVGMMNHCFRLRFGLQPTAASIARAKNNCVKTQAYSFNIPSPQIRHKTSSDLLGRNRSPETGACDWQPQQIVSPECHRHSFGFLLCLSSASSCQRRTPSGSPPGFYQHISGGTHRATPELGRSQFDCFSRSVWRFGQRNLYFIFPAGIRYSTDNCCN